jgi:hypothetical protein
MQAGDLIKHRRNDSTALVISVVVDKDGRDPEYDREWATVLFTGDGRTSTVPLKLIKENWEIVDGET